MKPTYNLKLIFTVFIVMALAILGVGLVLSLAGKAQAAANPIASRLADGHWLIVAHYSGAISIVNVHTGQVHGPYLQGQLGSDNDGLLDVVVTPDGNTALVTNFGRQSVYFIDVSSPLSPSVVTSVTVPMFAEDIALSPDGKYALVTDGGFSSYIASIDVVAHSVVYTEDLGVNEAQAVAIAPDGTVVMANYWAGKLHTRILEASGALGPGFTYTYTINKTSQTIGFTTGAEWAVPFPANVTIAPDGQTVIVCDGMPYSYTESYQWFDIAVYQITAPGVMTFTDAITNLVRAPQSVAFNLEGTQAYLTGNDGLETPAEADRVTFLNIPAPGQVELGQPLFIGLPRRTTGHLYGVDTIATAGGKVWVAHQSTWDADKNLIMLDLSGLSMTALALFDQPHGIAAIPPRVLFLPHLSAPPR